MAKTTYASMKMKVQTNPKEIDFNGNKIEILQYLPIEDKYDLVMVTLQKSLEDGVYNPIKKDMYFHLYLVYMYTDITFTDKQKEDESKLYDVLESNGLITEVIKNIPEEEYNKLFEYMNELMDLTFEYKKSSSAMISNIIETLPDKAQEAVDVLNNFDPEKFQLVQDFAKAANGGRDIQ
jgi:hypothetical protein